MINREKFIQQVKGKKIRWTGWPDYIDYEYFVPNGIGSGAGFEGIIYRDSGLSENESFVILNGFESDNSSDFHWEFVEEDKKEKSTVDGFSKLDAYYEHGRFICSMTEEQRAEFTDQVRGKKIRWTGWPSGEYFIPHDAEGAIFVGVNNTGYHTRHFIAEGFKASIKHHWEFCDDVDTGADIKESQGNCICDMLEVIMKEGRCKCGGFQREMAAEVAAKEKR